MSDKFTATGVITIPLEKPIHVTGRFNLRTREITFDEPVEIPSGGTFELGEMTVIEGPA